MKFNLLLTNERRVRWLWWGLLGYLGGLIGLMIRHVVPGFWLLLALPLMLCVTLLFFDKLFRQSGWALVSTDGITWANSADSLPASWQFAEISTYRFEFYRNGIKLFMCLRDGQKLKLDAQYSLEYGALQKAFAQAVQRYNQAHPGAEITVEKSFFERPVSGKILLGLLVASAPLVAWGISHKATAAVCLPVSVVLLTYASVWAAYSGRRE